MAISRISVKKSPSLRRKLDVIEGKGINLAESPHFKGAFILNCLKYWENNIYKVFNKRRRLELPLTGQLGKSLKIAYSQPSQSISFSMKHLRHTGADGESGGKTADYGRYLRGKSEFGGQGTYVQWLYNRKTGERKLFDKKIKRGTTRRVNPQYWARWMAMFKPRVRTYAKEMIEKIYKDGVDECNG